MVYNLYAIIRLLLHSETSDGSVIPVWEEVDSENISVLKEVMASRSTVDERVELRYVRIPITAERPPDFSDLTELIDIAVRHRNVPIVVNCQLGRGRSTMTSVSFN
jgi:protein-tyrosine phosphatase